MRALLRAQSPGLADLPLTPFRGGWDNVHFRLGDSLLIRMPRRRLAVDLIRNELRWLPTIAPHLWGATPVPAFEGAPGQGYPWPWAIVAFVPGTPAGELPVEQRAEAAEPLADFFSSLHTPAPLGAPENPVRGMSIDRPELDQRVRERLTRLEDGPRAALTERWDAWRHAPEWDSPDVWLHGDPHPYNMILDDDGRLAGVIDWGDLTAGDPACDLATAWLTFDAPARRVFVDRTNLYGRFDTATWDRARAWAIHLGLIFALESDEPGLRRCGEHALRETLAEPVHASALLTT